MQRQHMPDRRIRLSYFGQGFYYFLEFCSLFSGPDEERDPRHFMSCVYPPLKEISSSTPATGSIAEVRGIVYIPTPDDLGLVL